MSGGQIWNRQTRYYDPGVNPRPKNPSWGFSVYHGARAKHDGNDGFKLDKNRIAAAKAKRARKCAERGAAVGYMYSGQYTSRLDCEIGMPRKKLASARKRRWWTR